MGQPTSDGPIEIALVGDLTDNEGELTDKLLAVPPGGHCTLWIDSPGGSPYSRHVAHVADAAARHRKRRAS